MSVEEFNTELVAPFTQRRRYVSRKVMEKELEQFRRAQTELKEVGGEA